MLFDLNVYEDCIPINLSFCAYCGCQQGKKTCTCKDNYIGDGVTCEVKELPINRCLQDNGLCHQDAKCTDLHFEGMAERSAALKVRSKIININDLFFDVKYFCLIFFFLCAVCFIASVTGVQMPHLVCSTCVRIRVSTSGTTPLHSKPALQREARWPHTPSSPTHSR